MDRNKVVKAVLFIVCAVSVYLIIIGELAMLRIVPLHLERMSNPWGLVAVLEGSVGLGFVGYIHMRKEVRELREEIDRLKYLKMN